MSDSEVTTPDQKRVPTLRLLKTVVQVTFVVDNGDTLEELPAQTVQVAPAGWAKFAEQGLDQIREDLLAQLLKQ